MALRNARSRSYSTDRFEKHTAETGIYQFEADGEELGLTNYPDRIVLKSERTGKEIIFELATALSADHVKRYIPTGYHKHHKMHIVISFSQSFIPFA